MSQDHQHEPFFDGSFWAAKALDDYVSYKEFSEFVGNSRALQAYTDSFQLLSIGNPILPDSDTEAKLKRGKVNALVASLGHYGAQSIVSLSTTLEVVMRDFFTQLFVQHPKLAHDYVGSDQKKGTVPFNDVLEHESRTALLFHIAKQAAGTASKGKYSNALQRVGKLCSVKVPQEIVVGATRLQYLRNRVVHERDRPDLDLHAVGTAHDCVRDVVHFLCMAGETKQIKGCKEFLLPISFTVDENSYISTLVAERLYPSHVPES